MLTSEKPETSIVLESSSTNATTEGMDTVCRTHASFMPAAHGLATHEYDLVCKIFVRIALRLAEKTAEASNNTDTPETTEPVQ